MFGTILLGPAGVLEPFFREVIVAGYLSRASDEPDGVLTVTPRGRAEVDKLTAGAGAAGAGAGANQ